MSTESGQLQDHVEIDRPGLTEVVTRVPQGIEHMFFVDVPLLDGQLRLMTLGLTPRLVSAETIHLDDSNGQMAMSYGRLVAFDANAMPLPAWFDVVDGDIVINVDDTDATYPIVVDPLAQSPFFTKFKLNRLVGTLVGGGVLLGDGHDGYAVARADFNDDGYDDLVVSSPLACGLTNADCQLNEGILEVYMGAQNGPSTTPSYTLDSDIGGAQMGRSLVAGKIGALPVIVAGAPLGDNGQTDEGLVFVFRASGPATALVWARTRLDSNVAGQQLGKSVALANTNSAGVAGANEVLANGLTVVREWTVSTAGVITAGGSTFANSNNLGNLGVITRIPDMDNDGDDELAVSVPSRPASGSGINFVPAGGSVLLYRGSSAGLGLLTTQFVNCPNTSGANAYIHEWCFPRRW